MINDHIPFRIDCLPVRREQTRDQGTGGIAYPMADMSHEKLIVIAQK